MDSLEVNEKTDGVVIHVRAQPGARRNAVTGTHDGALKIAVSAAPERGKANEAIIEVLANYLSVPRFNIQQISGATHRQKAFYIKGITAEMVMQKLSASE